MLVPKGVCVPLYIIVWFTSVLHSSFQLYFCSADVPKPTIQQLMEELYNTVASKWKSIGTLLDITGEELSTISQREHGDPQECLVATLRAWLHQTNPPASWRKIANAVDFIGKPDIAQQIRQKYCKHAST